MISLVVERRAAQRSEAYPETADLVRLLEAAPSDEGSDGERAQLLAFARQRARGGGGDLGKAAAAVATATSICRPPTSTRSIAPSAS